MPDNFFQLQIHYDDCLNNNFKLIPNKNELKQLKEDYIQMQQSGMFSEKTLPFAEIISILKKLEVKINQLQ